MLLSSGPVDCLGVPPATDEAMRLSSGPETCVGVPLATDEAMRLSSGGGVTREPTAAADRGRDVALIRALRERLGLRRGGAAVDGEHQHDGAGGDQRGERGQGGDEVGTQLSGGDGVCEL